MYNAKNIGPTITYASKELKGDLLAKVSDIIRDNINYQTRTTPHAGTSAPGPGSRSASSGSVIGKGVISSGLDPVKWLQISHHHFLNKPKFGKGIVSIMKSGKKPGAKPQKILFLPNRKVSDSMREILLLIFKNKALPDLSDLVPEDREYLYKILSLTEVPIDEEVNRMQAKRVKDLKASLKESARENSMRASLKGATDRLTLLLGSVDAGNKANELVYREGTQILNRLLQHGYITREEARAYQQKLI